MIALTISEPWAWAIVDLSRISAEWKRVENRHERFPARIAGEQLLIHSGQGTQYARPSRYRACCLAIRQISGCSPPPFAEIRGRGLIGVAKVAAVVSVAKLRTDSGWAERLGLDPRRLQSWAAGPSCVCLGDVAPFEVPISFRGQQGLFSVTTPAVDAAVEAAWERAAIREFGGG